jgi:F-type H+-transporting ATPase subunit alpha
MEGMVLSLERDIVSIAIFGNDRNVRQGEWVFCTGMPMSVPVTVGTLGTVIDPLGNTLLKGKQFKVSSTTSATK